VLAALGVRRGRSAARVALDSGVPVARVRALLTEWELEGLAEKSSDGWSRPRRARRGGA
jgi:DNA processing protein